jgi:hypothetical protein
MTKWQVADSEPKFDSDSMNLVAVCQKAFCFGLLISSPRHSLKKKKIILVNQVVITKCH